MVPARRRSFFAATKVSKAEPLAIYLDHHGALKAFGTRSCEGAFDEGNGEPA